MDGVFPWLTYDNLIIFGLTVCGIVFVPNLIIAIYDFGIKGNLKTRELMVGLAVFVPLSVIGLPFAARKEDEADPIYGMFLMGLLFCLGIVIIAIGMVGMELG